MSLLGRIDKLARLAPAHRRKAWFRWRARRLMKQMDRARRA